MAGYTPQIKVVNGKIHGAKRLAKTPKHQKNNGYTAFVRCIHFCENNYSSTDLEKFLEFEHDAWNTCDARAMHPLEHAVLACKFWKDGLKRKDRLQENDQFIIDWYERHILLGEKVINAICEHLDVSEMDDPQLVRLVGVVMGNSEEPWAEVARKSLVRQGVGVTIFPEVDQTPSSIPMLWIMKALGGGSGSIGAIKGWLDDGVAHDPPNHMSGTGLKAVLDELERCSHSIIRALEPQITEVVEAMACKLGAGMNREVARSMARSRIDKVIDIGIKATRHSTDAAMGLLSGIAESRLVIDDERGRCERLQNYMRALVGIRDKVDTAAMASMISRAGGILDPMTLAQAIDTLQEEYGLPEALRNDQAGKTVDEMVNRLFSSNLVEMRPAQIKSLIEHSRRVMHPCQVGALDEAIIQRMLSSALHVQSPNKVRALLDFLDGGKRLHGAHPTIDIMFCSWKRSKGITMDADVHLVGELVRALTTSGWRPSEHLPATMLKMINEGISCPWPIIDLHLENFKQNGSVDPGQLVGLLRDCFDVPAETIDPSTGYVEFYPWEESDCWPAKSRVLDAVLDVCHRQSLAGEVMVRACDDALRNILSDADLSHEQCINMIKCLIGRCEWTYEKSAARVPTGGKHWLAGRDQQAIAEPLSELCHEGLVCNVPASNAPRKPGPRF